MIGASEGYLLAANPIPTATAESETCYQVSNQAVAAFPTQPTVSTSTVLFGVAVCTTSPVTLSSGATVAIYLPASSGVAGMAGHFA